jgi:hypothetical protein
MVGGQPKKAALAITASTRSISLLRSKARRSPVSALTATMSTLCSGQVCMGSCAATICRRLEPFPPATASASAPIRWRIAVGLPPACFARAKSARSCTQATVGGGSAGCALGLTRRWNISSSATRLVRCSATLAPDEVPTKRSAFRTSRPASAMPVMRPISHALAAYPPPARTKARRVMLS